MATRFYSRLFLAFACISLPALFVGFSRAGVSGAHAGAHALTDNGAPNSYLADTKPEASKHGEPGKGLEKSTADSKVKTPVSARVRFVPQKDGVWSVAETANFRIFFRGDVKPIDKMAQILEESRQSAYEKWFGQAEDTWSPKCYLYLDDAGKEFKKAPKNARGYTSSYQKGWNYHRYITVHADDPDLCDTVLPHEVTHAVLIGHFVDQIPTWADEGMAGLAQRQADLKDFHKLLERGKRKDKLFSLQTLVELDGYPDDDVDLFYAQSAAVVDFLTSQKEPKVFVAFLRDGKKDGWLPALKKHYGYAGFEEFEKKWKEHVFSKDREAPKGFTQNKPNGRASRLLSASATRELSLRAPSGIRLNLSPNHQSILPIQRAVRPGFVLGISANSALEKTNKQVSLARDSQREGHPTRNEVLPMSAPSPALLISPSIALLF